MSTRRVSRDGEICKRICSLQHHRHGDIVNMDDMDDSIFALLAGSSDEEEGLASTSYRELPREQVWSDTALVDAWSAALAEFVVGTGYLVRRSFLRHDSLFVCFIERLFLSIHWNTGHPA